MTLNFRSVSNLTEFQNWVGHIVTHTFSVNEINFAQWIIALIIDSKRQDHWFDFRPVLATSYKRRENGIHSIPAQTWHYGDSLERGMLDLDRLASPSEPPYSSKYILQSMNTYYTLIVHRPIVL